MTATPATPEAEPADAPTGDRDPMDRDPMDRAVDAVRGGASVKAAAEGYGVPRSTLARHCKRAGVTAVTVGRVSTPHRPAADDNAGARKAQREGGDHSSGGGDHGVTTGGDHPAPAVNTRRIGRERIANVERCERSAVAARMRLDGSRLEDVAEALGCAMSTASRLAAEGLAAREVMGLEARAAIVDHVVVTHLGIVADSARAQRESLEQGELGDWARAVVVSQRSLEALAKIMGAGEMVALPDADARDPIAEGLAQLAAHLGGESG